MFRIWILNRRIKECIIVIFKTTKIKVYPLKTIARFKDQINLNY